MSADTHESLEDVLRRLQAMYEKSEDLKSMHPVEEPEGVVVKANGQPGYPGYQLDHGADNTMLPLLAGIALIPHNVPNDFAVLFRYFADLSPHAASINLPKLVYRLRTALFKAVPLLGVPRVINAQASLYEAVKAHPRAKEILAHLPTKSTKPTKTTEEDSQVGWAFFSAIYERHAQAIFDRISETSPDLAEMIVDELYGANLSRTEVLSWKETVLIEFAGCASLDCPPQAKGHFFGCRNLQVGKKNVSLAIEVVKAICSWRGEPFDESRMPFLQTLESWTQ